MILTEMGSKLKPKVKFFIVDTIQIQQFESLKICRWHTEPKQIGLERKQLATNDEYGTNHATDYKTRTTDSIRAERRPQETSGGVQGGERTILV